MAFKQLFSAEKHEGIQDEHRMLMDDLKISKDCVRVFHKKYFNFNFQSNDSFLLISD